MTKEIVVPSSPSEQKEIFAAIKEADESLIRIESEKSQIKAIIDELAEKYEGLGKKYIRKMIYTYHKNNFEKQVSELSDFEELYSAIVK